MGLWTPPQVPAVNFGWRSRLTARKVAWQRGVAVAASTSIAVVVFIFGALLLLIALIGGGFILKELSIPQVSRNARVACGVTGALFIGLGLWTGSERSSLPSPTTTTTTAISTTTLEAFPTERERDLLTHVSKSWRAGCHRYEHSQALTGERAYIQCTPSYGATSVWYVAFDNADHLYQWYYGVTDNKNIARASGDCAKVQVAEGTYHYDSDPRVDVGHFACWRDGQQSRIVWTHTELHIGAEAYRNDLNDADLYNWWRTDGHVLDPGSP
jgi:hypothetical protein